jgi:exonuclease VII small subunit
MSPYLLGLLIGELLLLGSFVYAVRRDARRARLLDAFGEVEDLVVRALETGRRAQNAELPLFERYALLAQAKETLDQAASLIQQASGPAPSGRSR